MRGRPREFDRDDVLERAMMLFWERGYEATAISDLTATLGIGRQSLYSTFGDKRQLYEAALARYVERRVDPIIACLRAPGSPLANVRASFEFVRQEALSSGLGCMVGHTIAELGTRDPELAAAMGRQLQRVEDAYARALRRAQQEGELGPEASPRALARTAVTLLQGLAITMPALRSEPFAKDVLASFDSLLR